MNFRYLLGFALLLLSSCSIGTGRTASGPSSDLAKMSGRQVQQIDNVLESALAERHISGASLAIVQDGAVLYAKGYGLSDREAEILARPDTRFLIASITKMFTAVSVMMLVEDGKLALDAPIRSYMPEIAEPWRQVSVRQLLTHTSGVPSFTSYETPPCGRPKPESLYDADDVLAEVSCLPLDFEPGSDWRYSDTGYHLLGLIIERVSGRSYEAFLQARIFAPLKMRSTRLIARPGEADDRAQGYRWHGGAYHRAPTNPLYPLVEMAAGGLASNVFDLARFDGALAKGTLVSRERLAEMWRPAGIGSAMYGMGFAVRPVSGRHQVGHTGGGPGATTSFARFDGDRLTIVLLTNTAQPPFTVQDIIGEVAEVALKGETGAT